MGSDVINLTRAKPGVDHAQPDIKLAGSQQQSRDNHTVLTNNHQPVAAAKTKPLQARCELIGPSSEFAVCQ